MKSSCGFKSRQCCLRTYIASGVTSPQPSITSSASPRAWHQRPVRRPTRNRRNRTSDRQAGCFFSQVIAGDPWPQWFRAYLQCGTNFLQFERNQGLSAFSRAFGPSCAGRGVGARCIFRSAHLFHVLPSANSEPYRNMYDI